MAWGKTLDLNEIQGPVPELFWDSFKDYNYKNPNKDRTLAGKKRRKARRKHEDLGGRPQGTA